MPVAADGDPSAAVTKAVGEWLLSPSLVRLAHRAARLHRLGREDTEDLVQELRLALLVGGADRLINSSYVLQTAKNRAADIARCICRSHRGDLPTWSYAHETMPTELKCLVRVQLASLPAVLQAYCALRFEEALNHKEIGERLGLSRCSVRWLESRLPREMAGLRSRLGRQKNLSLRKILVANSLPSAD